MCGLWGLRQLEVERGFPRLPLTACLDILPLRPAAGMHLAKKQTNDLPCQPPHLAEKHTSNLPC